MSMVTSTTGPIRVVLAATLPLVSHGVILGAAWLAGRLFATEDGNTSRAVAAAIVMFGALELGLAAVCITLTVVHNERQERPMALAVSTGWLLGAFLTAGAIGLSA
jgi:uncharacterized membrane protein YidH (DUF202 family)